MGTKQYRLDRFIQAQERTYQGALQEITEGKKRNHWMWYIFPQLRALGRSSTAQYYGIEDIEEAKAYLAHPILGTRLREISRALLSLKTHDPLEVMGHPDHLKLCSCMTLFALAEGSDAVFSLVLDKFYGGVMDGLTVELLQADTYGQNKER